MLSHPTVRETTQRANRNNAYVGEQVTVRYDPRDIGEIRVYFNDGFLCRAIAPELAAEAVTLEQLRGVRAHRRRELKQQLRDRRSLADALPSDTRYARATSRPSSSATKRC